MPEETAPAAPPAEEPASSAHADTSGEGERDGNAWLRESAAGLIYSRPAQTGKGSSEWDAANAELRRGRRNGKQEESKPSRDGEPTTEPEKPEPTSSSREEDDKGFERRVQAEVDRREAVRRQRSEAQQERELRSKDPQGYARYKEEQEQQNLAAASLGNALRSLSSQFDEATVTPLVHALPEAARADVLKDPGHGVEGRRTIVTRAIEALRKASYDEGFAKGREQAQKSLRRSSSFRKEMLNELRGEEEEPELAPGNGRGNGRDFDMNDFMRSALGRRVSTSRSTEE